MRALYGGGERELAQRLQEIAWDFVVRPQIDPSQNQRDALLGDPERASWNRIMLALRRVANVAGMALRRNENAASEQETGFLKMIDGTLLARWIEPVHPSWRLAPVVVLDASHHQTIAERFVPDIVEMARVDPGPAVGSCHVRQMFDASFALGQIDKQLNGDQCEAFLRELAIWAEVGLALTNGGTGLLVASKRLEEALVEWWKASPLGGLPAGLYTAHFNALRGRDDWRAVQWLGIVGRIMPSEEQLRDLAAVIDGQPAARADQVWRDGVWADAGNAEQEWVREGTVPGREDGLEQALLDMIGPDELAQAVGRARLVRRPLAGVAVDIKTNHPIPGIAVNELIKLEEMMKDHDAEALAAARGIVFEPGAKGGWDALAVVTGAPAEASRKASERAAARGGKSRSDGHVLIEKNSLIRRCPFEGIRNFVAHPPAPCLRAAATRRWFCACSPPGFGHGGGCGSGVIVMRSRSRSGR